MKSLWLIGVVGMVVGGCASAADGTVDQSTSEDLSMSAIQACKADSDCVAVDKVGCCPNGWKEAVNKHHVAAYEHSFKCPQAHPVCPLYVINDTRNVECVSDKCAMVPTSCVQTVLCIKGDHFDTDVCACVPN
jgi:hypothetical protein